MVAVNPEDRHLPVEAFRAGLPAADASGIGLSEGAETEAVATGPARGPDAGRRSLGDAVDEELHRIRGQVQRSNSLNELAGSQRREIGADRAVVARPKFTKTQEAVVEVESDSSATAVLEEDLAVGRGRSEVVGLEPEFEGDVFVIPTAGC